jgi:tetratricopeptide (TPR) repeat protein
VALGNLGGAHRVRGQPRQAEACFAESLELFRQLNLSQEQAKALTGLGHLRREVGQLPAAADAYVAAIAIFAGQGLGHHVAAATYQLGNVVRELGDVTEASQLAEESVTFFDQHVSTSPVTRLHHSWALLVLGIIRTDQGDYDRARELIERSLSIFREIHAREGEGYALWRLHDNAYRRGDLSAAGTYGNQALIVFSGIDHQRGEALVRIRLGRLQTTRRNWDGARSHLDRALELARDHEDRYAQGRALERLAALHAAMRKPADAVQVYEECVRVYQETGRQRARACALRDLGHALRSVGQREEAARRWQEAATLFDSMDASTEATEVRALATKRTQRGRTRRSRR